MANHLAQKFSPLLGNYSKYKIGIVCAEWNAEVNNLMLANAEKTLKILGIKKVDRIKVPGSFEIPFATKQMLQNKYDAVICFGTIVKGETMHDVVLAHSVTDALMTLNIQQNIPIILGVLTVNTQKQALDRANGKYGNKGKECAEAALRMIEVKNELKSKSKK
ncbi:MAG: hypothetical protein RJA07_1933 [Bacteroidota bacterium]|jgi:6,7-dimethyl-8-ribityllumazine synthase